MTIQTTDIGLSETAAPYNVILSKIVIISNYELRIMNYLGFVSGLED